MLYSAEMGDSVYSSGMCLNCYKEYLENTGGQAEGHNPPAYTRGLIKAAKAPEVGDTAAGLVAVYFCHRDYMLCYGHDLQRRDHDRIICHDTGTVCFIASD